MIPRVHLLAVLIVSLSVTSSVRILCAETAEASPAGQLLEACKAATLATAQLKQYYVECQAQRLTGKLPYPVPTQMDAVRAYERLHNKVLNRDQLARLAGYLEKLRQQMQKKTIPLAPDELEKLEAWFQARPTFRDRLLLALDPRTDNVPEGVRVALAIREKYPAESESLENLTLAFAAVWDEPEVAGKTMVGAIRELQAASTKPCPYLDSFGWYAQHKEVLCPWFAQTPWRLLVYLADEGIALSERDYLLQGLKFSPTLGTAYSKIPFDSSKLKDNVGQLGKNAYSLENLTKFGGIQRDQAYFARSVCRAFGMPAYMASGRSPTSGEQAWVGWIVCERKEYRLLSHGRDPADEHLAIAITDPASGEALDDYLLGILAKGLSDEKSYDEADLLYRIWHEVGGKLEPTTQTKLFLTALKRNAFHHAAWRAAGEATSSGALPAHVAGTQWRELTRDFMDFPDFISCMAGPFSRMHKTAQDKYRFYEQTAMIFTRLKRQDLLAGLRLAQAQMCEEEGRKDLAAQVAITGLRECSGTGTQCTELARKAISWMPELKQPEAVTQALKTAVAGIPKSNAGRTNPDWLEMAMLLAQAYRASGNENAATKLEDEMFRMQARDR